MDWKTAVARDDFERAIADLPFEVAGVFDADGKRRFAKPGDADQVGFTRSELARLPGTVLVHNHPNGSSLSYQDAIFAEKHDLAEIIAVVRFEKRLIRFSLTPGPIPGLETGIWPPFSDLFLYFGPILEDFRLKWFSAGLDGTVAPEFARHQFMHEFWSGQRPTVIQRYGLSYRYSREEL